MERQGLGFWRGSGEWGLVGPKYNELSMIESLRVKTLIDKQLDRRDRGLEKTLKMTN